MASGGKGWKAPEGKGARRPSPGPAAPRRIVLVDRPGAAQTELVIGNLTFDRRDPDWFALAVLNPVFGGGTGSRLFRTLRNEKGYVFNVQSVYTSTRFRRFWQVRAGTRTDATGDTGAI